MKHKDNCSWELKPLQHQCICGEKPTHKLIAGDQILGLYLSKQERVLCDACALKWLNGKLKI